MNPENTDRLHKGCRILTLCTDNSMRDYVGRCFEGSECLLFEADNSMTGLDLALTRNPEVILVSLQGINDRVDRLLKILRLSERTADTVIIVIQPGGTQIDTVDYLFWGADDVITVPFAPEELLRLISARIKLHEYRKVSLQNNLIEFKRHIQNLIPPHFNEALANIEGLARAMVIPSVTLPIETIHEKARQISAESTKLNDALERFKKFSKIEVMCMEQTLSEATPQWIESNTANIIQELVERKVRETDRQADFEIEVETNLIPISRLFIETLLEEFLVYILQNSPSKVKIHLSYHIQKGNLIILVQSRKSSHSIRKKTGGIYIMPEEQRQSGSIIGLAISQRLAELGRGCMFHSPHGHSEVFIRIELPIPENSIPQGCVHKNKSPCTEESLKGAIQDFSSIKGEFTTDSTG